jgi:hypothetical protein
MAVTTSGEGGVLPFDVLGYKQGTKIEEKKDCV